MRKVTSIKRIIYQFRGVPVEDIALIQSYYVNKDPDKIKFILNKHLTNNK